MKLVITIIPPTNPRDPVFVLGVIGRYVRWVCDLVFVRGYDVEMEVKE